MRVDQFIKQIQEKLWAKAFACKKKNGLQNFRLSGVILNEEIRNMAKKQSMTPRQHDHVAANTVLEKKQCEHNSA